MRLKNLFSGSENPNSLGARFRNKRFKYFEERVNQLAKPVKILDVGGTELFWINRGFANNADYQVTLINRKAFTTTTTNCESLVGDATDLSLFKDKEFNVSFSNSVIEHLETWDNQVKMANEIRRTGNYYFVQTPNKWFPIEPHYLLPFFQFMPCKLRYFILTKTKLSRGHTWQSQFVVQYLKEIRLLTLNQLRKLFPGSNVYYEKFLGMTKSFTMHNFED